MHAVRAASLRGCRCNGAPGPRGMARPCVHKFRNPARRWRVRVRSSLPAPSSQPHPAPGQSPPGARAHGRSATGPMAARPRQWRRHHHQRWKLPAPSPDVPVQRLHPRHWKSAKAHPVRVPRHAAPGWPLRFRRPTDRPPTARQLQPDARPGESRSANPQRRH
ncbi:hypothetical protein D3C87_1360720 [compost metagenome]